MLKVTFRSCTFHLEKTWKWLQVSHLSKLCCTYFLYSKQPCISLCVCACVTTQCTHPLQTSWNLKHVVICYIMSASTSYFLIQFWLILVRVRAITLSFSYQRKRSNFLPDRYNLFPPTNHLLKKLKIIVINSFY